MAVAHPENILRRHIAVSDSHHMNRRKTGGNRSCVSKSLSQPARPIRRQRIPERPAGRQLHRDEPMAVGSPKIEDPTNVWMPDRAGHLHLASEPFDPTLFLGAIGPEDLEGDRLTQDPVPGTKDLAAPPFADRSLNLKSRIENGTRLDPSSLSSGRPSDLDSGVDLIETVGSNV